MPRSVPRPHVRQRRRWRRGATAALCAAALFAAGCQDAPPAPVFANLSFAHLGVFNLDVATIEVVAAYDPPVHPPNVDHLFPVPPLQAAQRWADDRLAAVGVSGAAIFTVNNASVIETRLVPGAGIRGVVTIDQSERYDALLSVQLMIQRNGVSRAVTAAKVNHSRTVDENITLNQREEVWFAMTETLLRELNAQLERDIPEYLGDYLR